VIDASTGVQTLIASERICSRAWRRALCSSLRDWRKFQLKPLLRRSLPGDPTRARRARRPRQPHVLHVRFDGKSGVDCASRWRSADGLHRRFGFANQVARMTCTSDRFNGDQFAVAVAAGGTYYVRVYATNATGTGPPSTRNCLCGSEQDIAHRDNPGSAGLTARS